MNKGSSTSGPGSGVHIATLVHEGRIWEGYLEFEDDPRHPTVYRGRMRFDPTDGMPGSRTARTTVIIIEDSYEEAIYRIRSFDERQLQGLLRSCLPEEHA